MLHIQTNIYQDTLESFEDLDTENPPFIHGHQSPG